MTGIERLFEVVRELGRFSFCYDLYETLGNIADQIERERACDGDTIENVRLIVGGVVDDMERHVSGVEGAEDSPVARWARELREALGGDVRDPAADVSVSAYDLLPADERDAIAWVRDHGGLDSVKKLLDWVVGHCSTRQQLDFDFWLSGRVMHELGFDEDMADRGEVERRLLARLMPEGMSWPVFEDGEPVRIGDKFECWCGEEHVVGSVSFRGSCAVLNMSHAHSFVVGHGPETVHGERVKRPAPKVLDADGVEIRVGDTVYYVDGREQKVNMVARLTDGLVQFGRINEAGYVTYCEGACISPDQLTHRAPVLAADGEPLRDGETVWVTSDSPCDAPLDKGDEVTVRHAYPKTVSVEDEAGESWIVYTDHLTHQRPVLDADGVPIKKGDTVYLLPGEWCDKFPLLRCHEWDAMRVLSLSPDHDTGRIECETSPGSVVCYPYPSQLTHERPERKCRDCAHWQKDPTANNMGVCWFFYHEHEGEDCYAARRADIGACEEFVPKGKELAGDA